VLGLSRTRDTIGLHATTVEDLRRVDGVVVPAPAIDMPSLSGIRLGMPRSRFEDIDPAVAAALDSAIAEFRHAGVRLVDVDLPGDLADAILGEDLVLFEAPALLLARRPDLTLADLAERVASPDVRFVLESLVADPVGVERYREARRARARLRRAYADALGDLDALVFPTCPVLPPPVGVDDVVALGGRLAPLFPTITRNTGPGSVAGVPAVTIPAGRFVGLTLEGRFFDDPRLLALAHTLEACRIPQAPGT
jgi:mandelamide amidase